VDSAGTVPRAVFVDDDPRSGLRVGLTGRLGSSTAGSAGSASGGGVAKIGGAGRPCGSKNSVMTHQGTSDATDETDDAIS
jgi:hypothetical protein